MDIRDYGLLTVCMLLWMPFAVACQQETSSLPPNHPTTPIHGRVAEALEADYLLITRVPAAGSTDCLFVRYIVTKDRLRFFVLHSEAAFNVRFFPLRARGMVGTASSDYTQLQQKDNNFNELWYAAGDSVSTPLKAGSLFYDPREALETLSRFVPRQKLALSGQPLSDSGLTFEGDAGENHYRQKCLPDGTLLEEAVEKSGHPVALTRYEYAGNGFDRHLKSMSCQMQPQVFQVANGGNVTIAAAGRATAERRRNDLRGAERLELQLSRLKTVPYVHHAGGRTALVRFRDHQEQNGKAMTVPHEFSVRATIGESKASTVREAHLLKMTVVSREEAERQLSDDYFPDMPLFDAVMKWTGRHASSQFRGEKVESDLREFRTFVKGGNFASADSPLVNRIRVASRNLDIEIYRHDRHVVRAALAEYFNIAADSPLQKFQPELAVWLLRRIDTNGTADIYEDSVLQITEHLAKSMTPDQILESMEHTLQLGFSPWAFFHWSTTTLSDAEIVKSNPSSIVSTPSRHLTPRQRLLRVYLASRLMPSFRAILASPSAGQSGFLTIDGARSKAVFTQEEIAETADAILAEAVAAKEKLEVNDLRFSESILNTIKANLAPSNQVFLPLESEN